MCGASCSDPHRLGPAQAMMEACPRPRPVTGGPLNLRIQIAVRCQTPGRDRCPEWPLPLPLAGSWAASWASLQVQMPTMVGGTSVVFRATVRPAHGWPAGHRRSVGSAFSPDQSRISGLHRSSRNGYGHASRCWSRSQRACDRPAQTLHAERIGGDVQRPSPVPSPKGSVMRDISSPPIRIGGGATAVSR